MVDDMYVGAEGKTFETGNDAERFGIECIGATDGFLENSGEDDLRVRGSSSPLDNASMNTRLGTYLPTSKVGDAMGENSVTI